jgi:protein CpxP
MKYIRVALAAVLTLAMVASSGCNQPECREVPPIAEVEEELAEKIEDKLDDVDATKAQRQAVLKIARGFMPRYEAMRREIQPKTIAFMRELQLNEPSEARVLALFEEMSNYFRGFSYELMDALVAVNRILTPVQRKALLKEETKPKKPFEGSWLVDRSIDILLWQINATSEQKKLTVEFKDELIRRSQPLQKELERLRLKMVLELGRENPGVDALRADLDAFGEALKVFVPQALAYYLAWHAKLKPEQAAVISGYLKRFEPCDVFSDPAAAGETVGTAVSINP